MADFTYNGSTKKLKVAAVTPKLIGQLFKLDVKTLVICDADEGEVHLPDKTGQYFEIPLLDGHSYEVDGTELAEIEAKQAAELARQTAADQLALANRRVLDERDKAVAVLKGKQRDNLIVDVIASTKDLNTSVGMLFHGPQAVVLIEALTILAGVGPDTTLVNKDMSAETFKKLRTPTSFKACLYQVAASMCGAFRQAELSMNTIRAQLVDLPDYFVATIEVAGEDNNEATVKVVKRTTDKINAASLRCIEEAKNASKVFTDVIDEISELCQAALTAKGTNEAALQELKQLKLALAEKKKLLEQSEIELKEQYEETKARANEALNEYKDQVKNGGSMGKIFLAALADGIMETVRAVASMPGKTLEKLEEVIPRPPSLPEQVIYSSTIKYAMESSLLQIFEKLVEDLDRVFELTEATIDDYILSLENAEKYPPLSEEGKKLFEVAMKTKKFLEKNKTRLTEAALKPEIDQLKVSIKALISAAKSVRQERQQQTERVTVARLSFAEKLIQAETDQKQMAKSHYSEEREKEEAQRKELRETRRELSELLGKLQSLNLEEINLNDIIQYLREGVDYLGRVNENWHELTKFFNSILVIVETNLKGNIDTFITEARDPASRRLMLQSALKATGYCIQVGNCAQIYSLVSGKYVMPRISGIGRQFALTRQEAKAKKGEIQELLRSSESGVLELINQERAAFNARFEEQMEAYANTFALSVTNRPPPGALKN